MDDRQRQLRNRNRILAMQGDTASGRDSTRGRMEPGATLVGKVYDGGSHPTVAGKYVLVHPGRLKSPQQEGPASSYQWDLAQSIPVAVLGTQVPAVGDILDCYAVANRWVADGGYGAPLPCGCGATNPDFLDDWHITDNAGSHTLVWTPARSAFIGTSTVQCLGMISTGVVSPPDFGFTPNFEPVSVTVTYALEPCVSGGGGSRLWRLTMSFNGAFHFGLSNCPWAVRDGDGGTFMFYQPSTTPTFSCSSTILSFTFCPWLNCLSTQASCVDGTGFTTVGATPGGGGTRVVSR